LNRDRENTMNGLTSRRLRSYTFNELIQRTLAIYRSNFATLLVPVAVVIIPLTAANVLIGSWTLNRMQGLIADPASLDFSGSTNPFANGQMMTLFGDLITAALISLLVSAVGALIQDVILNGLITIVASESHLERHITLGQALAMVRERWLPFTLGMLSFYLLLTALFIGLTVILFACGLGIGFLVYVWVGLHSLLAPVFLLERTTLTEGLTRSWALGKKKIWWLCGVTLLVTALSFAASQLVGVLPNNVVVDIAAQSLITILIAPLGPIAFTLFYYEARVRYEALDEAFARVEKSDPRPADVLSPHPAGSFMDNNDFVNLAILTFAMFILTLVYSALTASLGRGARLPL
jgi:hypothetical protein